MTKDKRWSKNHSECVECGLTDRVHHKEGYCERCSHRKSYRTNEAFRKARKAAMKKWYEAHREERIKIMREYSTIYNKTRRAK